MRLVTVLAVLCTTNIVLGWYRGYQAVGAYAVFWLLIALTFLTAWNIVSRIFAPAPALEASVRVAVISFAIVVACGLSLGLLKRLTLGNYVAAETVLFLATLFIPRSEIPRSEARGGELEKTAGTPDLPAWVVGVVTTLLAFGVAFAMTHSPLTLYDSVSYHLFFPARWLQEHALSIIPTPFSDEAQAYAPANGELFFLWLMMPFHGDFMARVGQLPFTILVFLVLYLLGRRLGAAPHHAVYPPAFFLLSRPILEQTIGANVDLVCAAMFLTSLYLGLVALDTNARRDWILCGVSLGLYAGSKYLALVYAPVFLLLAVAGRPRVQMLWTVAGIAALALPWYARNWIVAGSPIYPASVQIAGQTLARGAFTRQAMLNTVFHTGDARLLFTIAARAFGPTLFLVWIPVTILGGVRLVQRGWWPHGLVFLTPFLMLPLYWFGFPVNVDSRFLMPAISLALLPFAFTFRRDRLANAALHAGYFAAMIWILVGAHRQLSPPWSMAEPWFMSGWLALDGLVRPAFVSWFIALASLTAVAWQLGPRRTRWALPLAVSLFASTTTALAIGGDRWCEPPGCEYLDVTSPFIRPNLIAGWQWFGDHARSSVVAYTGINLPYPLAGDHLTNRVVYANIDGRLQWRFHDYDRAYRAGRFNPIPPVLATSSGELMPVSGRAGPHEDASRPRYERMQGLRDAWIDNLRRLGVTYLFISALSAYDIDNVWHNSGGFPIEDEWAAADPGAFQLSYENPQVRVYRVVLHEGLP